MKCGITITAIHKITVIGPNGQPFSGYFDDLVSAGYFFALLDADAELSDIQVEVPNAE